MASFDKPYIPNVSNMLSQAREGYTLGTGMRQQNAMAQAGQSLASGNQQGAVNALYKGGQLDAGMKLDAQFKSDARQAAADKLAKAQRFNDLAGNVAMLADTPEKWDVAITRMLDQGLDVEKYRDFSTRDLVLARAGMAKDVLNQELKRREMEMGGKPTAGMKEYRFDMQQRQQQGQPTIPFSEWQKQTKAPLVQFTGEKEYDKTRGKSLAEDFGTLQTQASSAANRIGQLRQVDELLSDPNVYTGTGGEAINALKRTAQTLLGQDIKGVDSADAARRISTEMALSLKENLPGPMSNADREFLQSIPPNIGDTAQGRKLLVELMVAKEERKVELAQLARQYARQKGGRLDDGWYRVLAQYNAQNPVFTPEMMQRARQVSGKARQASPAAGTLPQVSSDADYADVPSGSRYIDPEGNIRTKR